MSVADYHSYFVGGQEWGWSVWAHNSDRCVVPTDTGFDVQHRGQILKTFPKKAAANSYRRHLDNLAQQAAKAETQALAHEESATVRTTTIEGQEYTPVFQRDAQHTLTKVSPGVRAKIDTALRKGSVPPKGQTGIVPSELTGYDFKIKLKGTGGNMRIHGKLSGNQIIFDKVTTK